MSYLYKNIDIKNLIQSGNSSAPPGFTGFPVSTKYQYTSGLDKPFNFSYTSSSGLDASQYATAITHAYNSSASGISTLIPGTNSHFKHVSGYFFGGGGGGGGGGGTGVEYNGYSYSYKGGGDGTGGGQGGYVAILPTAINGSNISIVVGVAGGQGNGGGGANKGKGGNGNNGTPGGQSYILIGNSQIAAANGGGGGYGGNGGTSSGGGSTNNTTVSNGKGETNAPGVVGPSTGYPSQNLSTYQAGGSGGGGAGSGNVNSGDYGNNGKPGYVQIYFSYQ